MTRKIEQQMVRAIREGRNWSSGNTRVEECPTGTYGRNSAVYLHGNLIARVYAARITFTLAGWPTPTTRSRLNALLREFTTGFRLHQHRGAQYLASAFANRPETYVEPKDWLVLPLPFFGQQEVNHVA